LLGGQFCPQPAFSHLRNWASHSTPGRPWCWLPPHFAAGVARSWICPKRTIAKSKTRFNLTVSLLGAPTERGLPLPPAQTVSLATAPPHAPRRRSIHPCGPALQHGDSW